MSATGSVIAQFETADGERTGPQLDVPLGTTPAELAVIVNELLRNDESVPYAFYVAEEEVSSSLAAAIGGASTEQAQINVAVAVAEQIRDYLLSGEVRNSINVPSVSPEQAEAVAPYIELGEKLGAFQGQLAQGRVDVVEVEYSGDVAELKVAPITIAVLKGILSSVREGVNLVNAAHQAQELGIKVIETKVARPDDFASRVTVKVKGVVDRLVAGAVFHGDQPRIVRIDDFMLEVIPEGRTLLLHNHDQSGVVGRVGSILGQADINISRMQLALQESRGEACMLVNIDQDPGDAVLSSLRDVDNMIAVQLLEL